MSVFIIILRLISIKLCYDLAKKNNYNVTLWTVLAIFIGYLALITLIIINIVKKRGTKGEVTLLIIFISISIGLVMYYKPIHVEKTYYGNMLDGQKILKKNIYVNINGEIYKDINGHKQINGTMKLYDKEYILDYLLEKDNNYKLFSIDKESNVEVTQVYISKDFKSINIIFDDSDKEYSGYTIAAVSKE
ncbi:hypothetical protein [Clostridium sp. ZS2-4]|uniref:hypothetical protein n=1 Tax=Clostridium sp. ZS2-4 TaxID=2987703 RepID=UPI00227A8139|nr:hypothetical protein [Clostridium sp. ZS2-4]MCY6356428.1 hypothetical protein [Clostridium sp. ZS2-4]